MFNSACVKGQAGRAVGYKAFQIDFNVNDRHTGRIHSVDPSIPSPLVIVVGIAEEGIGNDEVPPYRNWWR
jgi:hypothetical protein